MHPQGSQNTSSSSGQNSNGQAGPYQRESRALYTPMYSSGSTVSNSTGSGMPQMFTNMNYQNYGPKFGPNNGTPVPMGGMDWSPTRRASYGSPFFILPNSGVIGGVQQASTFVPTTMNGQTDQMGQLPGHLGRYQFVPNNPSALYGPGTYRGHIPAWQIAATYGMQDKQGASVEESPFQYYPATYVPTFDGNGIATYQYPMVPGYSSAPIPWQMMKTNNGYVMQDMEAVTQQEPAIPRAVPAMWTNASDMTIAKCLENREGITNVYIRGFLPETTDDMLHAYAARFGPIERCKAIVDLDSGLCKGFGFVQFYTYESCENCIRGFFYLGYQASFAQKSRNSRLKDLEDQSSTNIYCTNIPISWTEADLRRHFEPYNVVSEKISRDDKTGVSKEVGFARFDTRAIAEKVLSEYHNVTKENGVKLLLRFADTKAQKILKQQSNERRAYRAGEYNYSVEVVQGSTPSPNAMQRLQQIAAHLTPNSQGSFGSAGGMGSNWTPATSISPTYALMKKASNVARQASQASRTVNAIETTETQTTENIERTENTQNTENTKNTPTTYRPFQPCHSMTDISGGSSKTAMPSTPIRETRSCMSTPRKENTRGRSMSPMPSRMKLLQSSPRSVI